MPSRHELPTHLHVQDRFLYGLTMPQLCVLLGGATMAAAAWRDGPVLPPNLRAAVAATVLLVAAALALVRPAGRSLARWGLVLLRYAAVPKTAVWRPRPARAQRPRSDEHTAPTRTHVAAWAAMGAPIAKTRGPR